ncbi:hypothetical protein [Methanocella arvoryzae]|uniref:hypothetical protein n=1 Tax=Methanocella arvoryzae TaxID=1175445 RepID=UPI0011D1FB71|nr:hypothetical protein [Methanocella arvoryzae]
MSKKLLVLGILLIMGGAFLSGCICCCSTPDEGVFAPPAIPKFRGTVTPVITEKPVVVPNVTVVPSPTIVVTVQPNSR